MQSFITIQFCDLPPLLLLLPPMLLPLHRPHHSRSSKLQVQAAQSAGGGASGSISCHLEPV